MNKIKFAVIILLIGGMIMSYTRVNWQNAPSTATPVNAENLNIMDKGIAVAHSQLADIMNDITGLEADVSTNYAKKNEVNTLVGNKADKSYVDNGDDALNLRIDNLVIPISPENANIEVTDTHVSNAKNKEFTSLKNRLEESEEEAIEHKSILNNQTYLVDNILGVDSLFGDMSKWQIVACDYVVDNNQITLTQNITATNASIRYRPKLGTNFVSGHKYFIRFKVYAYQHSYAYVYCGDHFTEKVSLYANQWTDISVITTPQSNDELGFYFNYLDIGDQIGTKHIFKEPIVIDVTESYGNTDISLAKLNFITNKHFTSSWIANKKNDLFNENVGKKSVVVASNNSIYANGADYICDGNRDDEIINEIIKSGVKHIYFTDDSEFKIKAPITLSSDLTIESNGATLRLSENIETTLTADVSLGATAYPLENTMGFTLGMMVEIVNPDGTWLSGYISKINTFTNTVSVINKRNDKIVKKGAKFYNVSSVFHGDGVSNVTIKGIVIDGNYEGNYERSNDTFYAQNGITFVNATNCKVQNCSIVNGGRHGILLHDTIDCLISDSIFDGWGEHGIDVYTTYVASGHRKGPLTYTIIDNCICRNNTMCGIQLHRGNGVTINNCQCYGNSTGISMLEYAHANMISNCLSANNLKYGIILTSVSDVTVNGNIVKGNGLVGIQPNTNTEDVSITNNIVMENTSIGIQLDNTKNAVVSGNIIANNTSWAIWLNGVSEYNLVSNNNISSDVPNYRYAIVEKANDISNKNLITGNTVKGYAGTVTLVGNESVENNNILFN